MGYIFTKGKTMTLASRLFALLPELRVHSENDWGSTNSTFTAFNDGGVECEVGEYLYSMVRMLKPTRVLETGTHHGIGALYMALALHDNLSDIAPDVVGKLDTIEYLPENHQIASDRLARAGLSGFVECHLRNIKDFNPKDTEYQMIFLDTEPDSRFSELVKFYPNLSQGGYIFIHDTPRGLCQGNVNPDHPRLKSWPFGDIPKELNELVTNGELSVFYLPNPRGLIGFYKPHKDDYKWMKK